MYSIIGDTSLSNLMNNRNTSIPSMSIKIHSVPPSFISVAAALIVFRVIFMVHIVGVGIGPLRP